MSFFWVTRTDKTIIFNFTKNIFLFFILSILVLGIFFRFINLDKKIFWGDETFTSLQMSGYTVSELNQKFTHGQIIGIEDLQKFQKIDPEQTLVNTIESLTKDVHPPLYYIILRFWQQCFGSSVAVTRSLSAFISLLAFPCLYWLCIELFKSSLVAWIAIALIAISPFHVIYAQEARMYSLWTVTILLSSAALLRAIRLQNKLSWGLYTIALSMGLYTFLFTGFVAIGHGIYVVVSERFRLTKTFVSYLLASLTSLIIFSPWIWAMIANWSSFQSATSWSNQSQPFSFLFNNWLYNFSYVFVDFFFVFTYYPDSPFNWGFGKYLIPFLLAIVVYSIYLLCRKTPVRVWLFLLTLIGTTALAVILPDLISGGYKSIMGRYFIPCYLGIELVVANLLAIQINSINIWQQKLWRLIAIAIFTGGVLSCIISSQSEVWWNKRTTSYDRIQAVRIMNQSSTPLLIADNVFESLPLSYMLDPKIKILVINQSNIPKIPNGFSNVFLFDHSKELGVKLEKEQNYKINVAYKGRKQSLWQLQKS